MDTSIITTRNTYTRLQPDVSAKDKRPESIDGPSDANIGPLFRFNLLNSILPKKDLLVPLVNSTLETTVFRGDGLTLCSGQTLEATMNQQQGIALRAS